jgi:tetratricopeptide (TPR) repeat protein
VTKRGKDVIDPLRTPFLAVVSPEVRDVLRWSKTKTTAPAETVRFAEGFLGMLIEDQAVIPAMSDPVAVLAHTLTHHLWRPESASAWLNLGLALRRIALYRVNDPASDNDNRLSLAIASLDRALATEPDLTVTVIRAWCGKALVFCQKKSFTGAVDCARRALDADQSDPSLWLLYSSMLGLCGKDDAAKVAVGDAYAAYVAAGKPPGLAHIFATST